MREILFRGKIIDNGEWAYGCYVEAEKLDKSGTEYFIIEKKADGSSHMVIPETVGQYTGLKDKNGKRIYEGDIVDYEDESPGQYEYHDSTFINRGMIEYDDGVFYWTNLVAAQLYDTVYKGAADCVVIGNIHDNPELLEVEA